MRVLDGLGIKYELRQYQVDPRDLSAETVAAKIGLPAEQLFKTLAVRGERNGIFLAVISASEELDFKALARQTGDRKVDMLPLKEVQAATGYSPNPEPSERAAGDALSTR
jgi:Cys-tRNA(Pro)/Cys-tRNA(Cys) deacylase